MVVPLRRDELVRVGRKRRKNLVNGWFGLGRGRFLGADHPRRPMAEVLRVIMNLTASNAVFLPFAGDIASLPYVGHWRTIVLHGGEVVVWSSED